MRVVIVCLCILSEVDSTLSGLCAAMSIMHVQMQHISRYQVTLIAEMI